MTKIAKYKHEKAFKHARNKNKITKPNPLVIVDIGLNNVTDRYVIAKIHPKKHNQKFNQISSKLTINYPFLLILLSLSLEIRESQTHLTYAPF